jgi:hypothetical protein
MAYVSRVRSCWESCKKSVLGLLKRFNTKHTSITLPLLVVESKVDVRDRPGLLSAFRSWMLDMLARLDCPLAVLLRSVMTSLEVSAFVGLPVDALVAAIS